MAYRHGVVTREMVDSYLRGQNLIPQSDLEIDIWFNNGKWQKQYDECVRNNYNLEDFDRWQYLQQVLKTELPFESAMKIVAAFAELDKDVLDIPFDTEALWNTDREGQRQINEAKELIAGFVEKEYGVQARFDDLSKILVAHNVIEVADKLHSVQAYINLEDMSIDQYVDGACVEREIFESIEDLKVNGLERLDVDTLVAVDEAVILGYELISKLARGTATDKDIEAMLNGDRYMRAALAEHGVALDKLVCDPDWYVRLEVVKQGRAQDLAILVHDPDWIVRTGVAEMEYGLDVLVRDQRQEVRAVAGEMLERRALREQNQGLEGKIAAAQARREPTNLSDYRGDRNGPEIE